MSVPIAGRRARPAAGATTSTEPQPNSLAAQTKTADDDFPDWLMDTSSTPAAAAATNANTSKPVDNVAPSQSSALDFLDFSAPPKPAPKPQDTSADAFLDFLSFDEPGPRRAPAATKPPAASQPATKKESSLPDFLAEDDDDAGLLGKRTTATATSASPTAAAPTQRQNALAKSWRETRAELDSALASLAECKKNIALLTVQDGADEEETPEHPLRREVAEADSELAALRAQLEEARAKKEELDKARATDAESVERKVQQDVETAASALRAELEASYVQASESASAEVASHTQLVASLRESVDAMRARCTDPSHTEGTVKELERRLGGLLRDMRADFSMNVKPLLSDAIRENMSSAGEQRRDIFHNDQRERAQRLRSYRQSRYNAFADFQSRRSAGLQERSNTFLHEFRTRVATQRTEQSERRRGILADHEACVQSLSKEHRAAAEQQWKQTLAAVQATHTATVERYQQEEQRLRQRFEGEMQLLRTQCQQQRDFLVSSRQAVQRVKLSEHAALCETSGDDNNNNSVRGAIDTGELRERARALRQSVEVGRQLLGNDNRRLRAQLTATPSSSGPSADVAARMQRLETTLQTLTGAVRQVATGLSPIVAEASNIQGTLRSKRSRLSALHDGMEECRKEWTKRVRNELARTLTSLHDEEEHKSGAPPPLRLLPDIEQELLSDLVATLRSRMEQQRQVRQLRERFTERVGVCVGVTEAETAKMSETLADIFEKLETLRRASTEVEAATKAAKLAEEDIRANQEAMHEEQQRLEQKRQYLHHLAVVLEAETSGVSAVAAGSDADTAQYETGSDGADVYGDDHHNTARAHASAILNEKDKSRAALLDSFLAHRARERSSARGQHMSQDAQPLTPSSSEGRRSHKPPSSHFIDHQQRPRREPQTRIYSERSQEDRHRSSPLPSAGDRTALSTESGGLIMDTSPSSGAAAADNFADTDFSTSLVQLDDFSFSETTSGSVDRSSYYNFNSYRGNLRDIGQDRTLTTPSTFLH